MDRGIGHEIAEQDKPGTKAGAFATALICLYWKLETNPNCAGTSCLLMNRTVCDI